MCISPSFFWLQRGPKWEQIPKPCGNCWRCKSNRLNDYVARCMAESSTSTQTCTLTLTYADRDDLADKVLQPRHFQLFMKLLRRRGHLVRYLVAGEYGALKGRAHFHAILFFKNFAPYFGPPAAYNPDHLLDPSKSSPFSRDVPQRKMCHISEWPHGHIKCDWSGTEQAARYVCKYLLDDDKNNAWFSLSKKPALGAAWFAQKAARAVELDVLPSTFEYLPPGGNRDRPYLMTGATRRDFLNAISQDESKRPVMSEWVLKTFDKYALARAKAAGEQWAIDNPDLYNESFLQRLEQSFVTNAKIFASQESQRLWDEYWAAHGGTPAMRAWIANQWGFTNGKDFEEYADQCHAAGTYLDGSPVVPDAVATGQHFPGCPCERCLVSNAA